MSYTYNDFLSAAEGAGMLGNFSKYDLDLAKKHPEFGLSILSLKKDYNNAKTDEQRLLANEAANELRKSYGNYTGGSDGSDYVSVGKVPSQMSGVLDQIGSFGKFEYDTPAPSYQNRYAEQQAALMEQLNNYAPFEWNKENDPSWSSYKKQYLREGERATANALAAAATATGGRPSTYAITAATQAGDYYGAQLADAIPQLRQDAYNEWQNDYNMLLQNLNALNQQEQMDYSKYLTQLEQHNADKQLAYDQWLQDYNMLTAQLAALQGQDNTDYSRYLDQINLEMQKEQAAQQKAQNDLANAMALWQTYGYVTPEISGILGLQAGTPTADQSYTDFQRANTLAKQASKGTDTDSGDDTESIIDTMLAYRDDRKAKEYLVSRGLKATEFNLLLELYEAEKEKTPTAGTEDEAVREELRALGIDDSVSFEEAVHIMGRGGLIEDESGKLRWAPGWNARNWKILLQQDGVFY